MKIFIFIQLNLSAVTHFSDEVVFKFIYFKISDNMYVFIMYNLMF
jgi:hypothetical protein